MLTKSSTKEYRGIQARRRHGELCDVTQRSFTLILPGLLVLEMHASPQDEWYRISKCTGIDLVKQSSLAAFMLLHAGPLQRRIKDCRTPNGNDTVRIAMS